MVNKQSMTHILNTKNKQIELEIKLRRLRLYYPLLKKKYLEISLQIHIKVCMKKIEKI